MRKLRLSSALPGRTVLCLYGAQVMGPRQRPLSLVSKYLKCYLMCTAGPSVDSTQVCVRAFGNYDDSDNVGRRPEARVWLCGLRYIGRRFNDWHTNRLHGRFMTHSRDCVIVGERSPVCWSDGVQIAHGQGTYVPLFNG